MQFGFKNNVLLWFESYLNNRQQRVVINGLESTWVHVTSGVPQGSILGPTLYLLYVNDLPMAVNSAEFILFADDAKFYKRISSLSDCISLQLDIDSLLQWCSEWKISINVTKVHLSNSLISVNLSLTLFTLCTTPSFLVFMILRTWRSPSLHHSHLINILII